jgi:hypothetical protein
MLSDRMKRQQYSRGRHRGCHQKRLERRFSALFRQFCGAFMDF